MKLFKFLQIFAFAALLGGAITMTVSCKEDDENQGGNELGTITGTVTDVANGNPIADITVTVSGMDGTVTTGSDGKYTVTNVTIESHAITFSKAGWLTTSVTVTAANFDANRVATADATLRGAAARIEGAVTDATHGNVPLSGVTVDIGAAGSATTGDNGRYTIENLVAEEYTVTFSKAGYPSATRAIVPSDFVSGVATVNVEMGLAELLREKTAFDLASADKWHYNEYRGGQRLSYNYPHWDWSTNYMATLEFYGNWESRDQGVALKIRNEGEQQNNPEDMSVFDSYMFGSKKITADTKILSLDVRTIGGTGESPVHFGIQVVDLSATEPAAVKVGDTKTHSDDAYRVFDFDLSDYIGKEVIVAVGIYRAASGNYDKQLAIRTLRFSSEIQTDNWMTGTEVIAGAKLTEEMVRSTMVNTKKSFTGISPEKGANNTDLGRIYQLLRPIDHVMANWSFVPVLKDPEPFADQGFIIKTRGTTEVSATVPEAYFYAKFAIASGNNTLILKGRTHTSGSVPVRYTYFKLTAIDETAPYTHVDIVPTPGETYDGDAPGDGFYKLQHYQGTKENPDAYATFTYDLSQFNGKNMVLMLGVYSMAPNTSENKLSIYSINLN
jgi:hypothetical protein